MKRKNAKIIKKNLVRTIVGVDTLFMLLLWGIHDVGKVMIHWRTNHGHNLWLRSME